jgi:hypothetical protein
VRDGFGADCFLAAASAAGAALEVGRGDSNAAFAADAGDAAVGDDAVGDDAVGDAAARGGDGADAEPGSGVMMLTAGVEAAVGNSALVGLPVGTDGESAATGATAAGAFHDAA